MSDLDEGRKPKVVRRHGFLVVDEMYYIRVSAVTHGLVAQTGRDMWLTDLFAGDTEVFSADFYHKVNAIKFMDEMLELIDGDE